MVGEAKKISKIVVISNEYKDTFGDIIDNLDIKSLSKSKSLDHLGLIDKRTHNMPRSRNSLLILLEEDCENVLITYLNWYPGFETYKYINTIILHFLIPRVGKHNMRRMKGVERMK